ncbi:MAG TPA: patatin-like phospholipase family protein [Rhodoblastus sp.]|nr:patatin-like phospholipase family protein [Rhodoblastus sp.]
MSAPAAASNRKRINLALQGGGAHGAFTWGALDAILADGRFEIAGLSGASAGAMNAVVLADGLREGGSDGARKQLKQFWRAISLDGQLDAAQRKLFDVYMGAFDPLKFSERMWQSASSFLSPYDFNPLDINPLRVALTKLVDFDALRTSDGPKLFISATDVTTGKIKIFERDKLKAEMVMASACLPTLFKAVDVDGVPYWDGGFSGNPPLFPFFYETECLDIVLIQLDPIMRPGTPDSAAEISQRMNEITFNAPLLGEFRAINFVSKLIDDGRLKGTTYKKIRMHLIEGGAALAAYTADTKMQADYGLFQKLFGLGRSAGEKFIADTYDAIGARATLDIQALLA